MPFCKKMIYLNSGMSIISLFLPAVAGYIGWVWYKFTKR